MAQGGGQGAGWQGRFSLKPGARSPVGGPGDAQVGALWSSVKAPAGAPRAVAPGSGLKEGAVVLR